MYSHLSSQISKVLATSARPLDSSLYPTWEKFLQDFLSVGGVLEAVPPCEYTALTVSLLLEPTGALQILSSADHLHLTGSASATDRDSSQSASSNPFFTAAYTMPQCSVQAALVNAACQKIAKACFDRQIRGYFAVDFVTFIDARSVFSSYFLHFIFYILCIFLHMDFSSIGLSMILVF